MIKIKRNASFADISRSYQLILDGVVIGELNNGQHASYEVPIGVHELQLKMDGFKSNKIEFETTDEDIHFECGNNCSGKSMLYTLFMKDGYIWLKRMD